MRVVQVRALFKIVDANQNWVLEKQEICDVMHVSDEAAKSHG